MRCAVRLGQIRKIWSDPMTLLDWAQFAALILAGLFFA
jgi:hypothetical protein